MIRAYEKSKDAAVKIGARHLKNGIRAFTI
jgi:hypothetical protein